MRPASASEEPPNLCAIEVGETGTATAFMEPPVKVPHRFGWIAWAPASVFGAGPSFAGIYLRTTDRTTGVVVVVVVVVMAIAMRMAQVEPMQRRSVKRRPLIAASQVEKTEPFVVRYRTMSGDASPFTLRYLRANGCWIQMTPLSDRHPPQQNIMQQRFAPAFERGRPGAFAEQDLQMTARAQQALGQFEPGRDRGDIVAHRGQQPLFLAGQRRGNRCDLQFIRTQWCLQQGEQFLALRRTQRAQSLAALEQFVAVARWLCDKVEGVGVVQNPRARLVQRAGAGVAPEQYAAQQRLLFRWPVGGAAECALRLRIRLRVADAFDQALAVLRQPVAAAKRVELHCEPRMQFRQPGDVLRGIVQLRRSQRPLQPVGACFGLDR